MNEFSKLFARDSKGKIKVWTIIVMDLTPHAKIVVHYGSYFGQHARKDTVIDHGKHIGKSNETTPYKQACLEAESKWKRRKDQGYKDYTDLLIDTTQYPDTDSLYNRLDELLPKSNTDASGNIKPMKAQPYYKKSNGDICIKFPCIGQSKINGIRCTAQLIDGQVQLLSKEGKAYDQVPHITDAFQCMQHHLFDYDGDELVYDGELYIHNELLQDIRSAAIKPNLNTPRIEFRVFDLAIAGIPQQERLDVLTTNMILFAIDAPIKQVKNNIIQNDKQAQAFTDFCIKAGYEGAIFRDPTAEYKFGKRPMTMTKLKRKESAEFSILDVLPMPKDPTLGMFLCQNDLNSKTFKVVPQGNRALKAEYLTNSDKYIGKDLTVEFYERTKDEVPFHAVGITIRDYE